MGKRTELIKTCEELKQKIRALQDLIVEKHQEIYKEIQLQYLTKCLSEIGRRLKNLTMYEDDND